MKSLYKNLLSALSICTVVLSCGKESAPVVENDELVSEITCDSWPFELEWETKSNMSNTGKFTWKTDDMLGFWPDKAHVNHGEPSMVIFDVKEGGSSTAQFVGNGWGLLRGNKYYAIYPYDEDATYSLASISYENQVQLLNNYTSLLGNFDYQYSSSTIPATGGASFSFSHIGCLVRVTVTVPDEYASTPFTEFSINSEDKLFVLNGTYCPSETESFSLIDRDLSYSQSIKLYSGILPEDKQLTIFMMMYPVNTSSHDIVFRLTDVEGNTLVSEPCDYGKNMIAGKSYGFSSDLKYQYVDVEGFEFDSESINVYVGGNVKLPYHIIPSYATNKTVIWSSSNDAVATVSENGTVSGIAPGNVTITGVSEDGAFSNTIEVAVLEPSAVDLGLSVYWASCNVGAFATEETGDFYAWAETVPKTKYVNFTHKYYRDGTYVKYNESKEYTLDLEDDAANANWGGNWRMPTAGECQELIDNCTWNSTIVNGIKGFLVTSNVSGYTNKSIFLPFTGYMDDDNLLWEEMYSGYRTSSTNNSGTIVNLAISNQNGHIILGSDWCSGYQVRAVYSK
ncbi:MAG TPA: hypothetical protein DHU72_07230 [Rikenellaceae bacterium]|nr:hypothetical protein [Rikenellaceae bacterium]